ncbi:MAG: multiheme c-type cytochrome [Deltaproteobacteria bacterium]|nr:multiheme c-type cytochrome [Deltaproteobacteria bacterium]
MVDLKIDLYLTAYNLMGYDAFTPGEVDLAVGVQTLLEKRKAAKFVFLLANLVYAGSKKPVFEPYLIKDIGGIKVGLFGLLSNKFPLAGPPEEKGKFELREPTGAAQRIIGELQKEKCRVIVAVAHMPLDEQKALVQTCPEVQFIISGHARDMMVGPVQVKETQILLAGTRGESLGKLDFSFAKKKLNSRYQLSFLEDKYADHPKAVDLITQYKTGIEKVLGGSGSAREESQRPPGQPLAYAISPYVGESVCLPCHPKQHEAWQKTPHARAFATLVKNQKASDSTCLPCHTTGLEAAGDSGNILENVQCEACHGPRRGHPDSQQKSTAVTESQCLPCHNAAKSPNFHYRTYRLKVSCPK